MKKTNVFSLIGVLFALFWVFPPRAVAAPEVKVSPGFGPPTTTVKVTGTGFSAGRMVDVFLDTTDMALKVTSATGTFTANIKVPASMEPGVHWVSAVVRNQSTGTQCSFRVRTNWSQFRFGTGRRGSNPYENVLSIFNVGGLNQAWMAPTG